jgi:hypothetical protein
MSECEGEWAREDVCGERCRLASRALTATGNALAHNPPPWPTPPSPTRHCHIPSLPPHSPNSHTFICFMLRDRLQNICRLSGTLAPHT